MAEEGREGKTFLVGFSSTGKPFEKLNPRHLKRRLEISPWSGGLEKVSKERRMGDAIISRNYL